MIGLIDYDSKIPNLALMKISAYYKSKGRHVEFYKHENRKKYDKIFASKIFDYTKLRFSIPNNTKCGGTGFDIHTKLPDEIEHIYPDYSLYGIDYAIGYVTRGCKHNCKFCIVPKKEGDLHFNTDITEFWDGQEKLMLLDNSITEIEKGIMILDAISHVDIKLNLTQGFNIRTMNYRIANILKNIKLWNNKQWHIAWDNINDEKLVFKGIKILNNIGIKNYKLMCYVLIGFNSTFFDDMYRVKKLNDNGIDPFVMMFKKTSYTKTFARWVNRKELFKSCTYHDFIKKRNDYKEIMQEIKHIKLPNFVKLSSYRNI